MVARAFDDEREAGDLAGDGKRLMALLAGLPHREEWILASNLEIDHAYQRRRIRQDLVKDIAENFDPEKFKTLLVNRRRWDNNRLFVPDGQHRLLGIRQMGWNDQLVPCQVYDNLPYAIEAKLFDTQGATRPLRPEEQFRSALARHEPEEEIVDGLVRRAGYQLNLDHGDLTEGRIVGVKTLKTILRRHGSGFLADVLDACRDGFGPALGPPAVFLNGMTVFLARYRGHERFDRARLITALRTKTIDGLTGEGGAFARTSNRPKAEGIAYHLHRAYNLHLGDDRRLPDWTVGGRASR